ncbi:MAG: endonuclease III [Hyphomicrobiaceae bacterium]
MKTPAKRAPKKAAKPAAAKKAAPHTSGKAKKAAPKQAAPRPKRPDPARVAGLFARFKAASPEPKGELEHVNAYTLLVAVVLSAQATDAGVNKATRPLFKVADTPQKMLALGEDQVRDYIKTIGLFRNKAKNVIALSEKLIAEHGGVVPADRDALTSLPGVGRKTANVVLNMAFGQKTMAVDTHVFRVSHRLDLSQGKNPDAVEADLMQVVPDEFLYHAHHWLILHGRYTCLARKPRCGLCPVAELCTSDEKTTS